MTKNRRRKAAPVPRGRRTAPRPAPCGPVSPGGRVRAVRPRADAYAELCLSNTADTSGIRRRRSKVRSAPFPPSAKTAPAPLLLLSPQSLEGGFAGGPLAGEESF